MGMQDHRHIYRLMVQDLKCFLAKRSVKNLLYVKGWKHAVKIDGKR